MDEEGNEIDMNDDGEDDEIDFEDDDDIDDLSDDDDDNEECNLTIIFQIVKMMMMTKMMMKMNILGPRIDDYIVLLLNYP